MLILRLALLSSLLFSAACTSDEGDDGSAPTPDAAPASADANPNGPDAMPSATLEFMDECDVADDQCDEANDEFCFGFNNKGPHCTHDCTGPEDCEAPSTGCNGMGVCKAP